MPPQVLRVVALFVVSALTFVSSARAGGPIASGSTMAGSLAGPGFSETWTFSGTIGQHVVITAMTPNGAVNTALTLKAPGGSIATSGSTRMDFTLSASGTWSIVVDDLAASTPTTYNITFLDLSGTLTSGADPDGGPITSNQILTGTSDVTSDLDAFTFSGTIGDRVELTVVPTSGASYSPLIYLYPPGGGSYVTASGRIDYQLAASGTWTAVVQDQNLQHTGTYTTSYLNVTAGPLTTAGDSDGGPIASGSIKTGTISGPGDFDGFTFTGTIGDHVILGALTTAGNLNTNVSLYPPGGGIAIAATSGDRVDAQLTASGTWTVVVEDYQDLASGSYSLSVMDLNGTLTSAGDADGGPITSNQILTGTTNVVGDFDAFTFNATVGDRMVLTTVETTAGASYAPTIYLYPPNGGSYVTASPRVDVQASASGTWTAVVQDQNLVNTGAYEISYLNVTSGPLTTAGDSDGGPIASGSIATGTISGPGDLDGFTFSGNSGDHVLLAALTTSGTLNTNMTLYPPGGGTSITASSADRLDAQLTATGTWTVVVEDYNDAASGSYSLSVMDLSGTTTSPGDLDGGPITSNQILTGTTNAPGDFDAYTFSGVSGSRVLMTAFATSGPPYVATVYLYPPGGGSYVTSANGRLDYQLTATGTYTAVVQDQSLFHTGTYELSYLNATLGPYTSVPDSDGGAILSGRIRTGTISGPGDLDAYTFSGSSGDHVILGAVTTSGAMNTNVSLYPPGGGSAIASTSADRQDVQLTVDGTYTMVVEDYSDLSSGTYSLSFLDLSGTMTSPSDLDGGLIASNQILTGTTNAVTDFDAFTFNGVAGDRVLMSVASTSGPPYRAQVFLYPPGGGGYVSSAYLGRLDYQLTATGTYTAVVQDVNLAYTGTYALSYLNVLAGYLTSGSDPDGTTIKPGDVKNGTINGPADFDAYWFTASSGETAHLTCLPTSGTLSPAITLYPPDGSAAIVYTTSHDVSQLLPLDGRYAVVIDDYGDTHTGGYQLTLTGSLTTVDVPPVGGPKLLDPTHVVFTAPLPNPARGPETLTFSLPTAQPVELDVYDTRGALVRRLDHGTEGAGIYARVWDGLDERGRRVRPGVYFSELRANGQTFRRALVRLE